MRTGDGPRPVVLGLAIVVVLLAITGVVAQSTIGESLGHWVIGGAVLGSLVLTIFGLRKRTT